MARIMFAYSMNGMAQAKRMKLRRKLLGYTDHSNMGRYRYDRNGLLSPLGHERPARCCILLDSRDAARVEAFFKENGIRYVKHALSS